MKPLVNMQLITNEISIKNNHLPDGQFNVSPTFTRNIGVVDEKRSYVELILTIANSPEAPFPVDIRISLTGIFDVSTIPQEAVDSFLKINAVQILFPYLRTMVSNITSAALMTPIVLPVIDVTTLFPEE